MKSLEDRFWERVDRRGADDCWPWTGGSGNGYGRLSIKRGHYVYAHRASYEIANGPIPAGFVVDHKCHNARCVNPAHLQAATQKQNMENRSGAKKNSKSGIRGVSPHADGGWSVVIGHNYKSVYGGYFKRLEDAEKAAKELRAKLFTNSLSDIEEEETAA